MKEGVSTSRRQISVDIALQVLLHIRQYLLVWFGFCSTLLKQENQQQQLEEKEGGDELALSSEFCRYGLVLVCCS